MPLRYSIFLPLLLPSSFPSFFTLYLPPPPSSFSLPPSSPKPSGAKTTCHAHSMKQSATAAHCRCAAREGCCPEHPLKVPYAPGWITTREGWRESMGRRLFPFGSWVPSEYLRGEVFYLGFLRTELYQNTGDKLSLESQIWRNILCDGKITRGLV